MRENSLRIERNLPRVAHAQGIAARADGTSLGFAIMYGILKKPTTMPLQISSRKLRACSYGFC